MDKYFNIISVVISVIGGFILNGLGGLDVFLDVLIFLVCTDYATGILKAIINKKWSSQVGFKGIAKKVAIFLVVAVAVKAEAIIIAVSGETIPIREMAIIFYIVNESGSFFENISEFVPVPDKLKEVFAQLNNTNNESE